jgi:hypothetical protein
MAISDIIRCHKILEIAPVNFLAAIKRTEQIHINYQAYFYNQSYDNVRVSLYRYLEYFLKTVHRKSRYLPLGRIYPQENKGARV